MKGTFIQLGHGSGGVLSRELLEHFVFSKFKNPHLDEKHDGAVLDMGTGEVVVSTDSFVISPIFFKGGDIGELAVNGSVNDVAMCGGIPKYLTLGFIIEEGLPFSDLDRIIASIGRAAEHAGVTVVTGDTKVVERGKGDKIFINTTGIGIKHPGAHISMRAVKPGDRIIVNAPIAAHGMAIMSEREGLEFESAIASDTRNLNHMVKELLDEFDHDIHLFRDATRGGVSGVLSEIASDTGLGVFIEENALPVDRQVAAACEMLGMDPLYVANEGVFLTVAASEVAEAVVQKLHGQGNAKAAIIGEITEEHGAKVIAQSTIGGKRVVTPLIGEQLPRIC